MADRYTYLPSLGVLILTIWGAYELTRHRRYAVVALAVTGGAALVLCLVLTRQQLGYWQDSEALFRHGVEVTGNNDRLHNGLGIALYKKGQTAAAIGQYREAIRLNPNYAQTHNSLGTALVRGGQIDEAIRQFQEAIRLDPGRPDAHYNLGTVLYQQGRTAEAIDQFREALNLVPDLANVPDLGAALGLKGAQAEAINQFREAARIKPGPAGAGKDSGADPFPATKAQAPPAPGAPTNR
jgi:tetratricopeptide (TPR) repeat protein